MTAKYKEEWQFRYPKCNFSKTFSEAAAALIAEEPLLMGSEL